MLVSQRMIRNNTGESTAQFKILKSHALLTKCMFTMHRQNAVHGEGGRGGINTMFSTW